MASLPWAARRPPGPRPRLASPPSVPKTGRRGPARPGAAVGRAAGPAAARPRPVGVGCLPSLFPALGSPASPCDGACLLAHRCFHRLRRRSRWRPPALANPGLVSGSRVERMCACMQYHASKLTLHQAPCFVSPRTAASRHPSECVGSAHDAAVSFNTINAPSSSDVIV